MSPVSAYLSARGFRDDEQTLLDLLTWRVRVATVEQMRSYVGIVTGRQVSSSLLPSLRKRGLLNQEFAVLAFQALQTPLLTWNPGEPAPSYGNLRWRLETRCFQTPNCRTTV